LIVSRSFRARPLRRVLCLTALVVGLCSVPADAHVRAHAYVSCGVGTFLPSHSCPIGDDPHAVFRDSAHRSRNYKVCMRGPQVHFCKRARQRGGRRSQVSLLTGNESIGWHTVKWFVRGKRKSVRTWNFYFSQGD
jgi:hypothetical protein